MKMARANAYMSTLFRYLSSFADVFTVIPLESIGIRPRLHGRASPGLLTSSLVTATSDRRLTIDRPLYCFWTQFNSWCCFVESPRLEAAWTDALPQPHAGDGVGCEEKLLAEDGAVLRIHGLQNDAVFSRCWWSRDNSCNKCQTKLIKPKLWINFYFEHVENTPKTIRWMYNLITDSNVWNLCGPTGSQWLWCLVYNFIE